MPVYDVRTVSLGQPAGYGFPPRDAASEKESFATHVEKYFNSREADFPSQAHLVLEELYTTARWSVPQDPLSPGAIYQYIHEVLVRSSSPGYPYCFAYSTNQALIQAKGEAWLVDQVEKRMRHLLTGGRCDPVRLFIKPEWHKLTKLVQKRYRLIWSISVVDQIIDGLLFGASLASEIKHHDSIPSKPGLSEFAGGMNRVFEQMEPEGEKHEFCETDKSAWDMTVPAWLYRMDSEARQRLCLNWDLAGECFRRLWAIRYSQLACSDVAFSDGTVLRQIKPGIVRSGSKLTISMNSRCQVALKVMYCLQHCGGFDVNRHKIFATGDDTIERVDGIDVEHYRSWLNSLGFVVKDVIEKFPTLIGRNFCGRVFIRHLAARGSVVFKPSYWDKNLFSITHPERPDVLVPMLASYCSEYAFDDDHFPQLYSLLCQLDFDHTYIRSIRFFRDRITGDERGQMSLEFDDS